ncbi:MAG: orotidine-5'-phosphate decarboxylase [Gammaproteobacteria bacterium]|nr:orotidine-5'-phosphate decarboxylase [Gammaproteobacteria bacterium]
METSTTFFDRLLERQKSVGSRLCIGLDPDLSRIPEVCKQSSQPIFEFNKAIIDATKDVAVAYKPNLAFYESLGSEGLKSLEKTMEYIPSEIFTIADAKRGDIGNTSKLYARAFFDNMNFDSITVAPYMGHDSVAPFLEFDNKWVILLALTSNEGALDFQFLQLDVGKNKLHEKVLQKSQEWGTTENMMYVVGATRGESIGKVRKLIPEHFLLVPGVGSQGGSLEDVAKYGLNMDCGLLVNSSRGIIYVSDGEDFADKAKECATELQQQMAHILSEANIL